MLIILALYYYYILVIKKDPSTATQSVTRDARKTSREERCHGTGLFYSYSRLRGGYGGHDGDDTSQLIIVTRPIHIRVVFFQIYPKSAKGRGSRQ